MVEETLSGSGGDPGSAAPTTSPAPTAAAAPEAKPTATRRRFLRYLVGFSVVSTIALIFTPVVAFLVPPKTSSTGAGGKTLVGTTADIPIGQGKVVPLGSKPTIVLNTDQGVKAYSAICTHLGCIVAWDDANGNIVCPCHDGRFNAASGAVVSGPPPAALPTVTVVVEEDQIFLVEAS